MTKEKLLLISCYFPPAGGIQVQRALSLARYLPENGFEVHVLSARNVSVPTLDPDLVELIPSEVKVHRTWTLEPPFYFRKKLWSRIRSNPKNASSGGNRIVARVRAAIAKQIARMLCPDPQVLWFPFAYWRAVRLIAKEQIQTLVVTAPPFSAFLILNALKRRFPHLRVIADIRDEWLRYFVKEFAFRGSEEVVARSAEIERQTIHSCERVVTVSEATRRELQLRYPEQPREKFALIPNGYDETVFARFDARPHDNGKVLITYTGTVYRPCSPVVFLNALDSLPDEISSGIECRFIGRIAEEFDRSVFLDRKVGLKITGFVPQHQAIRYMEESDVLLLPWSDSFNIPGKLFEYLATGKPILALVHPGSEIEQIINEANAGWCVNPDDAQGVRRAITEMYKYRGRFPGERNWKVVRRYERRCLAADYADVIRYASVPDNPEPAYAGD